ncbi:MAG: acyl-CoA synthetase [Fimbriimonadales bacterium]
MSCPDELNPSALMEMHEAVISYREEHGAPPDSPHVLSPEDVSDQDSAEPFFRASRAAAILDACPDEFHAQLALKEIGIQFPRSLVVSVKELESEAAFQQAQAAMPPGPVVVKLALPRVPHKSDFGGVRFLDSPDRIALLVFVDEVSKKLGTAVEAVEVSERVKVPYAGEGLLAATWDDEFGTVVTFGEGGTLTELRRTTVSWIPSQDFKARDIERLLLSLPLANHWFRGFRGNPPLVSPGPASTRMFNFGIMVWLFNMSGKGRVIRDLEINPLVPSPTGPYALDLLLDVGEYREPTKQRPDLLRLSRTMHSSKRIVVAGVSTSDTSNLGRTLFERLTREFKGEAVAVNPKGGEVAGRPVYKTFAEAYEKTGPADLAVFAVPARFTSASLEEAYEAYGQDIGCALIVTGGFDETEAGVEGAAELRRVIARYGSIPVIGPNTMALYSNTGSDGDVKVDFLPPDRMTIPSFADPSKNNLALVAQSGARFVSFLDKTPHLGFRWALLLGNSYQVDAADGLELAAADPNVKVVSAYVEGFGPGAGRRFFTAVERCVHRGKTVIVQKVGKTEKGARAARSHTASMGGSYKVFCAAMQQVGAIVADSDDRFIDLSEMASLLADRTPMGNRLFVVNSAGYEGVLVADAAAECGLELPPPTKMAHPETIVEKLSVYLKGTIDPHNNPADVGPMTPDKGYVEAVEAALADPIYDMALVAITPHGNAMRGTLPPYEGEGKIGPLLVDLWKRTSKPIVVSINGGSLYDGLDRYLGEHGIPVFRGAERAVYALAEWVKQRLAFRK